MTDPFAGAGDPRSLRRRRAVTGVAVLSVAALAAFGGFALLRDDGADGTGGPDGTGDTVRLGFVADPAPYDSVRMWHDEHACEDQLLPGALHVSDGGWCTTLKHPARFRPERPARIEYTACRLAGRDARTLRFKDAAEVFIQIRPREPGDVLRKDAVRNWGTDGPLVENIEPTHHTVTWRGGDCRTYAVTWDGTDEAGRPVAAGRYWIVTYAPNVSATVDAENAVAVPGQTRELTLVR